MVWGHKINCNPLIVILLLTFAFLDKIISPNIKTFTDISIFLRIPWGLLSLGIIFGIIAQLDSAIFFLNMGKSSGNLIEKCLFDLQQVNSEGKIEIPYQPIGFDKKIWSALAIDFYIIAVFCLCLVFLEKVIGSGVCWIILSITLSFLGLLNYYLIKKYKEIPTA